MSAYNNINPIGGNQYYTHIHSQGTSSAFDAGSVLTQGNIPYNSNLASGGGPFQYIDVNVFLADVVAGTSYPLSGPLPPGAVITSYSMNGHKDIIQGGVGGVYALGLTAFTGTISGVTGPVGAPSTYLVMANGGSATGTIPLGGNLTGAIGTTINGSVVGVVTELASSIAPQGPVFYVTSQGTTPDIGSVECKISYYLP
jgi:hypothetical protein